MDNKKRFEIGDVIPIGTKQAKIIDRKGDWVWGYCFTLEVDGKQFQTNSLTRPYGLKSQSQFKIGDSALVSRSSSEMKGKIGTIIDFEANGYVLVSFESGDQLYFHQNHLLKE